MENTLSRFLWLTVLRTQLTFLVLGIQQGSPYTLTESHHLNKAIDKRAVHRATCYYCSATLIWIRNLTKPPSGSACLTSLLTSVRKSVFELGGALS